MELPFAAVHQLCAPILDRLDALPEPQRDALSVALGLSSGEPRDHFLVALAVLSLLARRQRSGHCSAWWMTRSGWMAPRARSSASWRDGCSRNRWRSSSPCASPPARRRWKGCPTCRSRGLGSEDARALLATAVPGLLDDRVRDRIIAETRGNPLALLELSQHKSAPEIAGGFVAPRRGGSRRSPRAALHRHAPRTARRDAAAAAAGGGRTGGGRDTALARGGAARARSDGDLAPAEEARCWRSAASALPSSAGALGGVPDRVPGGSPQRPRGASGASDPDVDADRRAWHRALAAAGPDEDVAAELERSAGRAQVRGGLAAAADAPGARDGAHARSRRAARGARWRPRRPHCCRGAPEAALRLLGQAEAGPLDPLRARPAWQLASRTRRVRFQSRPRGAAAAARSRARARAARRLVAWDAYLDALSAALFVGRLAGEVGVLEVAQAARAASRTRGRRRTSCSTPWLS